MVLKNQRFREALRSTWQRYVAAPLPTENFDDQARHLARFGLTRRAGLIQRQFLLNVQNGPFLEGYPHWPACTDYEQGT